MCSGEDMHPEEGRSVDAIDRMVLPADAPFTAMHPRTTERPLPRIDGHTARQRAAWLARSLRPVRHAQGQRPAPEAARGILQRLIGSGKVCHHAIACASLEPPVSARCSHCSGTGAASPPLPHRVARGGADSPTQSRPSDGNVVSRSLRENEGAGT
jgi:hypothetical protein